MNDVAAEILDRLMDLDAGERRGRIEEWCEGDAALEREVEDLLAVYERAEKYFTPNVGERTLARSPGSRFLEKEGDRVGPYKLLERIGEGGFGVVWMAQQERPISRKVAVKVIKAGMDSREVVSRFDAERQALARMDHPNIARVIDAGLTDTGRPYFAMDLVKGMAITEFCDSHEMDAKARLGLFGDVCGAINHAHQKGVIHRDIKPSNILVTLDGDRPLVKVIDFGIAKAIEGKLTERTLFTKMEQWVGTPVYMSPEQSGLGSLDIDTRCDIYALGVLLYELLTGVTPFDEATLMGAGIDEMRRIIREVEPPKPSARLTSLGKEKASSVGAARKVSGEQLRRFVASDLDWIVMKAIDKSRDRRYGTASALADDIGRFLADEPVVAKPPSALYLFGKFSKRHRAAILVASGIAVLLVGAVLVSGWQAVRATRAEALSELRLGEAVEERNAKAEALQEVEAERNAKAAALEVVEAERNAKSVALEAAEAARNAKSVALEAAEAERNAKSEALKDAEAVSGLLSEVFRRSDPSVDGRAVTVVDALEAASEKLESGLEEQPGRLALLEGVLAGTYEALSLPGEALEMREKRLATLRKGRGVDHQETLEAMRDVAIHSERLGHFERVRELSETEIEIRLVKEEFADDAESLLWATMSAANAAFQTGDVERATVFQKDVVELNDRIYGGQSYASALARWDLHRFQNPLAAESEKRSALKSAEAAFSAALKNHGETDRRTLAALAAVAEARISAGLIDTGIATQIRLLALTQKKASPMDEAALRVRWRLAKMYYNAGRRREALAVEKQAVRLVTERDGKDAASTAQAEDRMLRTMFYADEAGEYRSWLRKIFEKRQEIFGSKDIRTLEVQTDLVNSLHYSGDKDEVAEAVALGVAAVSIMKEIKGRVSSRSYANTLTFVARCFCNVGRTQEAMELYRDGCPLARDDTWVNFQYANLQLWFDQKTGYNRTRAWMLDWLKDRGAGGHFVDRIAWIVCMSPLESERQGEMILAHLDRVEKLRSSPATPPQRVGVRYEQLQVLGLALFRTGSFGGAVKKFDEAEKLRKLSGHGGGGMEGNGSPHGIDFFKAMALHRLGRQMEAEAVYRRAVEGLGAEPSRTEPLEGINDADGQSLRKWLAFREAEEVFKTAQKR